MTLRARRAACWRREGFAGASEAGDGAVPAVATAGTGSACQGESEAAVVAGSAAATLAGGVDARRALQAMGSTRDAGRKGCTESGARPVARRSQGRARAFRALGRAQTGAGGWKTRSEIAERSVVMAGWVVERGGVLKG